MNNDNLHGTAITEIRRAAASDTRGKWSIDNENFHKSLQRSLVSKFSLSLSTIDRTVRIWQQNNSSLQISMIKTDEK